LYHPLLGFTDDDDGADPLNLVVSVEYGITAFDDVTDNPDLLPAPASTTAGRSSATSSSRIFASPGSPD
jgi:hypothetical protein